MDEIEMPQKVFCLHQKLIKENQNQNLKKALKRESKIKKLKRLLKLKKKEKNIKNELFKEYFTNYENPSDMSKKLRDTGGKKKKIKYI